MDVATELVDKQLDWRGMAEAGALIVVVVGSTILAGLTIVKLVAANSEGFRSLVELVKWLAEKDHKEPPA